MPKYKYQPESNNVTPTVSTFEVYDPESNQVTFQRVLKGQSFCTDRYLSKDITSKAGIAFIEDEPYVSPIIASYSGSGSNELELPDYSGLVDIYVSMLQGTSVELYFNNDSEHKMDIYHAGIVFRSILTNKIRTINTNSSGNYSIAVIESNQFTANSTTI